MATGKHLGRQSRANYPIQSQAFRSGSGDYCMIGDESGRLMCHPELGLWAERLTGQIVQLVSSIWFLHAEVSPRIRVAGSLTQDVICL